MSDTTKDLVNAIVKGDAMGTETNFAAAIADKITDKLDVMRQDVAKNMFATPEPEVALEDTEETVEPEAEIETAEEPQPEVADSEGGEIN